MYERLIKEKTQVNIEIDTDIYKKLTEISFAEHIQISDIINDALQENLNVYLLWKKIGYILVSKEVLKNSFAHLPAEDLTIASKKIAGKYKEASYFSYGKPSLDAYIDLIKSFAKLNGYNMELTKNIDGNDILIVQFDLGSKYSQFLGNAYRLLLEEFAIIRNFELTDSLVCYEYTPKKPKPPRKRLSRIQDNKKDIKHEYSR